MNKRIIINKGKKYIVNAPGYNDDVGPAAPSGVLWMKNITDGLWYEVMLSGTSGSLIQSASFNVNQTPLNFYSNELGYQLLYCYQNDEVYQVYLSGSTNNATMSISQTPWPVSDDYKPYLWMKSTTDGYYYPVYASSGSIYLFVDQNGRRWMDYPYTPSVTKERGGSLQFGGTNNRFLSISGGTDFVLGTGSYTVEWFQKQISFNSFDRVFTQVPWSNPRTAGWGVSIEGAGTGDFYLWSANVDQTSGVIPNKALITAPRLGVWDHIAVVRNSGSYVQIFRNGVAIKTITEATYLTSNITSSVPFIIGGEGDNTATTVWSGSITNFRLVKGYALYSQSYTVPTEPLRPVVGTVLLLDAMTSTDKWKDLSGLNKTITGNSVSWSAEYPTQFS